MAKVVYTCPDCGDEWEGNITFGDKYREMKRCLTCKQKLEAAIFANECMRTKTYPYENS